jgi:hypothetical protein
MEWEEFADRHLELSSLQETIKWLETTGDAQMASMDPSLFKHKNQAFLAFLGRDVAEKARHLFPKADDLINMCAQTDVRGVLAGWPRIEGRYIPHEDSEREDECKYTLGYETLTRLGTVQLASFLCERLSTNGASYVTSPLYVLILGRLLRACIHEKMTLSGTRTEWKQLVKAHWKQLDLTKSFREWLAMILGGPELKPNTLDSSLYLERTWQTVPWPSLLGEAFFIAFVKRVIKDARKHKSKLRMSEYMFAHTPQLFAYLMQLNPARTAEKDLRDWKYNTKMIDPAKYVGRLTLQHRLKTTCLDILRSDAYVRTLSDDDVELLALWTWACSVLQEGKVPSAEEIADIHTYQPRDTPQQVWLRQRLAYLIAQAPPSQRELVVFRGLSVNCGQVRLHSPNPMAVSYSPKIADTFRKEEDGCALRIVLPPGTRFLCVDTVSTIDSECELLLPPHAMLIDQENEAAHAEPNTQTRHTYTISWSNEKGNKASDVPPPPPIIYQIRGIETPELLFLLKKTHKELVGVESAIDMYKLDEDDAKSTLLDDLFYTVRSWQLVQCGFGPFEDASREFWRAMERACPINFFNTFSSMQAWILDAWSDRTTLYGKNTTLDNAQAAAKALREQDAKAAAAAAAAAAKLPDADVAMDDVKVSTDDDQDSSTRKRRRTTHKASTAAAVEE